MISRMFGRRFVAICGVLQPVYSADWFAQSYSTHAYTNAANASFCQIHELDRPNRQRHCSRRYGKSDEAILEYAPEGVNAVFPCDFFALGIVPAIIRNRDLIDAAVLAGHLGGDLDLETEVSLAQCE